VPLASLDDLQAVAHRAPAGAHDAYSELALAQRWEEYHPRRRDTLSPFALTVDGRPFATLYSAVLDPEVPADRVELVLTDPPPHGPGWEYLAPFSALQFLEDGGAELHGIEEGDHPLRRAIARIRLLDYFVPHSEDERTDAGVGLRPPVPFTTLLPLSRLVRAVRATGVVPLSVSLLLYLSDERVRIEVDLTDNRLLKDPRAGRLPMTRFATRSPRTAHLLDAYLARADLPGSTARAFEILAESTGLSSVELSQVLGGVREMTQGSLDLLVSRGLAALDQRTGTYRARLDALRPAAQRTESPEPPLPPLPHPELRTGVRELLAAADSRATCPLCGDPLPPHSRDLLCPRCAAEVEESSGTAPGSG